MIKWNNSLIAMTSLGNKKKILLMDMTSKEKRSMAALRLVSQDLFFLIHRSWTFSSKSSAVAAKYEASYSYEVFNLFNCDDMYLMKRVQILIRYMRDRWGSCTLGCFWTPSSEHECSNEALGMIERAACALLTYVRFKRGWGEIGCLRKGRRRRSRKPGFYLPLLATIAGLKNNERSLEERKKSSVIRSASQSVSQSVRGKEGGLVFFTS